MPQRRVFPAVVACVAGLFGAAHAAAQAYPQKPVRIIVPFAAGGAGDIFARTIAPKLTEVLGQQFMVDNRAGANGIIGMELAAKSPPDGYTLVMGNSAPMVLNPSLYQKLPYDPVRDFAPVILATTYAYVLIVHPSLPARTVQELVAIGRSRPGQLQYGSSGPGGANHLAGEMLSRAAGIRLVHVPFRGSAPALADTVAGHVPMMFDTIVTTVPHWKAGRVRALAVTGASRAPQLPDVATLGDVYPGFEVTSWQSLLAPTGTPRPIIDRLYQETARVLKSPDVVERLATQGGNVLVSSAPDEFAALIRKELGLYSKVIREANIRIEQ